MLSSSIVNFTHHNKAQGINIISPASGKIEALDTMQQDADLLSFIGQGVAIKLDAKEIVSPIKGTIVEWLPNLGKIIIQAPNKLRFLLQLPFGFGNHHGVGITPHINVGQPVDVNQPLMTLDLYKINLVHKPVLLAFLLLDHKVIESINVFNKRVTAGVDLVFSMVPKRTKQPQKKQNSNKKVGQAAPPRGTQRKTTQPRTKPEQLKASSKRASIDAKGRT